MPLSVPTDEAKSTARGLSLIVVMMTSFAIAGVATFSWSAGWFWEFILLEALLATGFYAVMRISLTRDRWGSME